LHALLLDQTDVALLTFGEAAFIGRELKVAEREYTFRAPPYRLEKIEGGYRDEIGMAMSDPILPTELAGMVNLGNIKRIEPSSATHEIQGSGTIVETLPASDLKPENIPIASGFGGLIKDERGDVHPIVDIQTGPGGTVTYLKTGKITSKSKRPYKKRKGAA
jgi:hypothetical protein